MSSSVPAVTKSSTSTQAQLVPSTSSVTVTSLSISQPPNSVIDTVSAASDNLSITTASSSSTACSVLETTTPTSNTIPTTSQDTAQTSKPRRKKRPLKNQSNTIKPKIEIKTVPHRPRKSAPTEYSTDEEDMITYDVEDEPELNAKPDTQNVVADVLSRDPVDNVEGSQISCTDLRALALNSREQLIQEQRDRSLHEFLFALRTAVNETTGKTLAELFLGRKIITPFRKLVLVTDGAEYVGGNIENFFDEARQNMQIQHKTWEKYYN
ncbi:uncharacterized protein TNCV_3416251 [Trichonephila clavipes]|nr:uncharacterized protein TNCV_3416251 [Trichonephila clavipes]